MPRRDGFGFVLRALEAVVVVAGVVQAIRSPAPRSAGVDPEAVAVGHERSDMRPGVVLAGLLLLAVTLGLVLFLVGLLESSLTGTPVVVSRPTPFVEALTPGPTPPAPRLEAQSGQELTAYRTATDQKLHSYRWVDRSQGVVAIPIDRAMDVVAEQGLPAQPGATPEAVPSRANSGRTP